MRPRRVTLYEVTAKEVIAGDFVEMANFFPQPSLAPFVDGQAAYSDSVKVERIPVHHIRECTAPSRRPYDGPPVYDDTYIAIEPRLREILEAPFVAQVAEANRNEALARSIADGYALKLDEFNSMPTWKRVWTAFKGGF